MNRKPHTVKVTPLQYRFIEAAEDEVLFGGAAGGGKSFGQLADALRYALTYPASRQLLLRRTLPRGNRRLRRTVPGRNFAGRCGSPTARPRCPGHRLAVLNHRPRSH